VFNRQNHFERFTLLQIFSLAFGTFFPFATAYAPNAETVSAAAQSLAEKVAAIPGIHGSLYLDWENQSSLTETQSQALRAQFVKQLNALRVALSEDGSAPALRVSLRETPSNLLFIASLQASGAEQIRIVEISRSAIAPEDLTPDAPRLVKKFVWRQREPILDAAETTVPGNGESFLLVLGKDSLSLYREEENAAVLRATAHLPPPSHPARDPRGRFWFLRDQVDTFVINLPGHTCHGKLGERLEPECTAAQVQKSGAADTSRTSWNLGDETVPLSSCDHAAWTLSSGATDRTVADHLLLRTAQSAAANVPVSVSQDVPGPVESISGTADSTSAVAVVFNLMTGNYEVYRVSFSCGN
jgi:hypothetical protein